MRTLYWLPRIFLAIGGLILLLSSWLYSRERAFVTHATRTTGTVTELHYETNTKGGSAYYPVFSFADARGQSVTVRSRIGSNPASRHVGEAVPILYDPADPQHASIESYFNLYLGSFIVSIFAVVFGSIGGIWLYRDRLAADFAEEMRHSGERIQARVVQIERRTNIRVGTTHPFRIIAEGSDVTFKSANIWFDPTPYVGETVNVFVDRNNPKRHLVDLEFLPKPS
jgi:hypothetical protein